MRTLFIGFILFASTYSLAEDTSNKNYTLFSHTSTVKIYSLTEEVITRVNKNAKDLAETITYRSCELTHSNFGDSALTMPHGCLHISLFTRISEANSLEEACNKAKESGFDAVKLLDHLSINVVNCGRD